LRGGMIISLSFFSAPNCAAVKYRGDISLTSSATAVSMRIGPVAAGGVRFRGAGGCVASSGGGAGDVGAGELFGAAVCCAINAGAIGAAAMALKKRLRFIVV
jgi:hypothetical protein